MSQFQDTTRLTIEQQHAAILQTCDKLLDALQAGSPVNQIGSLRMQLAGVLHANLVLEEAQLSGPIRRLPIPKRPIQFTEMAEEVAELRQRYSAHIGQWSIASIENDPLGYARASKNLVERVRTHLEKKRKLLPVWRLAI